MQVYISWLGQKSYKLSLLVRDLLRKITPGLEVFISSEDNLDGSRWSTDHARILNEVTFCILCVDRINYLSPWLLFELGAIAKAIDNKNIRILLQQLHSSTLEGPLSLFSPFSVDKTEFQKLIEDLQMNFPRIRIPRYEMIARLDENWETFDQAVFEIHREIQESTVRLEEDRVTTETVDKPVEYVNEIGQNIIALISVHEGIDEERIATTMYLHRSDTLRYLIDLENKGLVRSNLSFGIRRWYVTEMGRKYLPGEYQG